MKVWSLTMDEHPFNFSTCELLGYKLKNVQSLETAFTDPSRNKINVFLDPCHMIKLTRNVLAMSENIFSKDGLISWRHIVNVKSLQENCGLSIANKLTSRHTQFKNQKMKVALAVQVISTSVADALQYLHETEQNGYDFSEVRPTVTFLRNMDSLFDVLNSRNLHNKGFKSPINAENWPEKLHFLEATKTYLLSLRTSDGRFLYQTKKHTAITGFLINIESLIALVPQLLMIQQFALTYTFSQDHLELLFNAVRRAGSWYNNPNVKLFQATFEKILVRCGVQPGKTGNVSLLDSSDLTTPPLANSEIVMSPICR